MSTNVMPIPSTSTADESDELNLDDCFIRPDKQDPPSHPSARAANRSANNSSSSRISLSGSANKLLNLQSDNGQCDLPSGTGYLLELRNGYRPNSSCNRSSASRSRSTKSNGDEVSSLTYSDASSLTGTTFISLHNYKKKRDSNNGSSFQRRRRHSSNDSHGSHRSIADQDELQREDQIGEEDELNDDDASSTSYGNYTLGDTGSFSSSSYRHRSKSKGRSSRRSSIDSGSDSTVGSSVKSHASRPSRRSGNEDDGSTDNAMTESLLTHPFEFPSALTIAQFFFRQKQKVLNFILLLMTASLFIMVHDKISKAQFYYSRESMAIAPHTDPNRRLATSIDFGGGDCLWQPPQYEIPENIDFYKTLIAGYPSGDKRMIWLQMEALAGWPAKDEWDFAFIGMSNHPFIKANYPHHEGFWGWGSLADQTILMVPYIRRSMVEYHDVLKDLGYPITWDHPDIREKLLYIDKTPQELWYEWRDYRVMDEVHWWGWFIDYWMEGGLLRDIFTHKKVTLDHWNELMIRPFGTRDELRYDRFGDPSVVVRDSYDPHCAKGEISHGCAPVEVVSVDRLVDPSRGPAETAKIATALLSDSKTGDHVIAQQAWPCIWEELVEHKKGPKSIYDRPGKDYGYVDTGYNFSVEMLTEMLNELNRLIIKYSGIDWNTKPTANSLVALLMEHTNHLKVEINEVKSGRRKLQDKNFLGPRTREARRRLRATNTTIIETFGDIPIANESENQTQLIIDIHHRFSDIGQREFMKKRREARKARERRRAKINAWREKQKKQNEEEEKEGGAKKKRQKEGGAKKKKTKK